MKLTEKILDSIKNNLDEFIEEINEKKLENILREISNVYYNEGISVVSDEIYDYMKDKLKDKNPDNEFLDEIGAPVDKEEKVKLPCYMKSLNKIKPSTDELQKFTNKYKGPYVISDKLDGISGLLYVTEDEIKLYTRGDGEYGQDISNLVKYIFDVDGLREFQETISEPVCIRGELILSKNNFKKFKNKFKNARNAVAGLVNSKRVNHELAANVSFVAYSVLEPRMTQIKQFEYLEKLDFMINVKYKIKTELSNEYLSKYLEKRRKDSLYEIDGIVVFDSSTVYKNENKNPEWGFAFKSILTDQYAEVLVLDVLWEASMDGLLKPRVKIQPVNLVGATITYATAFHAKYVEEHKLGTGSLIKIIRSGDVIPHIMEVIKPASNNKPKMPDEDYIWDKNHVNIIVKDISTSKYADMIKAKRMDHFFTTIGVKNLGIGILVKLVKNKYDNVIDLLNADQDKLAKIEGLGKTIINKIFKNIKENITNAPLEQLMAGSHVFGSGLGEKKIKLIVKEIPDILETEINSELKKKINDIEGFSDLSTDKFVDNLTKFKTFYNQLKELYELKHTVEKKIEKTDKFKDMIIVFTGFRDKELEKLIEENGGRVSTSVSKKTSVVVYSEDSEKSSKLEKAKELKIKTLTRSEFNKEFNL